MQEWILNNRKKCQNKETADMYRKVDSIYPVLISEHLSRRMQDEIICGVKAQFLPNPCELEDEDGAGAFFDDEKHITETMVQKYPNRCIIYTTSHCFANCRHCSRKENWLHKEKYSRMLFDKAFLTILESPHIEEVILTGGDVLTIPLSDIDYMLSKLNQVPHVRVVRLGTRAFTSNPQVFSEDFCAILNKYKSVIICTQFNHPDEFCDETENALMRVQKTGTPVLNQMTLLKNINDSYHIMRKLLAKCAENRVVPYYLFHCFKVKGTQCFRTDIQTGFDIINELIGNVGGWWIPRYTLIPHITGVKVPVCHNGIVSQENGLTSVRDFKGRILRYE